MTLWDSPSGDELSEDELNDLLTKADDELLGYVRRHTHPRDALLAMMAATDTDSETAGPQASLPSVTPIRVPGDHAVTVIAMRLRTRDIDHALTELRGRVEPLAGARDHALGLKAGLAEYRVSGRAEARQAASRWRRLWLASVLVAAIDGAFGYAAVESMTGQRAAGLAGAAVSAIVLPALGYIVAVMRGRTSRLAISLVAGLAIYAGAILALGYLVFPAASRVAAAWPVAVTGFAALAVVTLSVAASRQGLPRWLPRQSGSARHFDLHEITAAIGVRNGHLAFASLIYRLETPVFELAASIERVEAGHEFRRELDWVRGWVRDVAAKAECGGDDNAVIRAQAASLAFVVEGLHDCLTELDQALAVVRSLLEAVVPRYLQDARRWASGTSKREREELLTRFTNLGGHSDIAGDKAACAADDLDNAICLNPLRQLAAIEIDASGADLSGAEIRDLALLEGVIWTEKTTWPPGLTKDRVRACSERLGPGVYRVLRDGNEREGNLVTV